MMSFQNSNIVIISKIICLFHLALFCYPKLVIFLAGKRTSTLNYSQNCNDLRMEKEQNLIISTTVFSLGLK